MLFLLTQWSVSLRRIVGFGVVNDLCQCTHVHVNASKNVGEDKIVPMMRIQSSSTSNEFGINTFKLHLWNLFFEFQKVKYSYDKEQNNFVALDYLTNGTVSQVNYF